jgi:tyrosinase
MYQAAHPDRNMEPEDIGNNGNVFLADGTMVDVNTPLLPFRKPGGGGAFWTPNEVAKTETFGYAYPETLKTATPSESDGEGEGDEEDEEENEGDWFARSVSTSIVQFYSSSARDVVTTSHATGGISTSLLLAADGTFTDWFISTSALAHALPSTFVVGSWVKMMPSTHEETRKRSVIVEKTYNSSVSLTSGLLDQVNAGKLGSLEERDVVPFLTERLSWKVVGVSYKS